MQASHSRRSSVSSNQSIPAFLQPFIGGAPAEAEAQAPAPASAQGSSLLPSRSLRRVPSRFQDQGLGARAGRRASGRPPWSGSSSRRRRRRSTWRKRCRPRTPSSRSSASGFRRPTPPFKGRPSSWRASRRRRSGTTSPSCSFNRKEAGGKVQASAGQCGLVASPGRGPDDAPGAAGGGPDGAGAREDGRQEGRGGP